MSRNKKRRRKRIKSRRQLKETQLSKRACPKCGGETRFVVCLACVMHTQKSA